MVAQPVRRGRPTTAGAVDHSTLRTLVPRSVREPVSHKRPLAARVWLLKCTSLLKTNKKESRCSTARSVRGTLNLMAVGSKPTTGVFCLL